ncbi:MAG: hypothetical protein HFJ27_06080 [Clostridia bacterium]|nr:hypothetical protein [Clostridia bacterium]
MGLWNDLKEMTRLSSVDGSKDYRKRLITGVDITSGKSCYQTSSKKRLENLQRVATPTVENSQTILMQIRELEERLHNSTSEKEKATLISTLDALYKKYNGVRYKEEKNKETSIDDEHELF